MSLGFARRVDRLEDALVIGEERQRFERLRRFHYNLRIASDEALQASVEAMQSGQPTPEWAEEEFQQPIPASAYPWIVKEAERLAREDMRRK